MLILALETSARSGSVALLDDERTIRALTLPEKSRTAQTLAPAVADVLQFCDRRPEDVGLVAVTHGPGSFTGIRVGVTMAKIFAYAVKAAVLGLNTLDVIAAQTDERADDDLWAVMDAQRRQLFAARFVPAAAGGWQSSQPTQIIDNSDWLEDLAAGSAVTGPGLRLLVDQLPRGVALVPEKHWLPQAATVGRLACERFAANDDDVWSLSPRYFRKSAAEEKLDSQ